MRKFMRDHDSNTLLVSGTRYGRVTQQVRLSESEYAPVFHGASSKIRDSDKVCEHTKSFYSLAPPLKNRPFSLYFTATTRIRQGFPFLCKQVLFYSHLAEIKNKMTGKPKRILVVKEHHGAMAYSHRFPDFSGHSNRICTTEKSTIEWFHFVLFTIMFIYFGSSCSVCNSLSSFIPALRIVCG